MQWLFQVSIFWILLCLLLVSKVFLNPGENWWPLIVKFWRILGISRRISEFFGGFPNARSKRMFPCSYEKSDDTMWESSSKSLTQRYAFSSCRRFSCYTVTMNMTLTDPKSRFRTVSRSFCDVWWHDHTPCSTPSSSRRMRNLISSGGRLHWSDSRQHSCNA